MSHPFRIDAHEPSSPTMAPTIRAEHGMPSSTSKRSRSEASTGRSSSTRTSAGLKVYVSFESNAVDPCRSPPGDGTPEVGGR